MPGPPESARRRRVAAIEAIDPPGVAWPDELTPIYVVTIRTWRWLGMQMRMAGWRRHLIEWPGTDGRKLEPGWWRRNDLAPGASLGRGQFGCYDSHRRAWRDLLERGRAAAVILEDDADLRYGRRTSRRLRDALAAIEEHALDWDLLYLGYGYRTRAPFGRPAPGLIRPRGCQGLFAYALTARGAAKLLREATPAREPVDMLVARLGDAGALGVLALDPPLCRFVPAVSDTSRIV